METTPDYVFDALYSILNGGMMLLNDLENYLRPLGLSQGRLAILLYASEKPIRDLNPGELSRITGKSRPTITRMVQRLERDGYLVSRTDSDDSRRRNLELTDSGRTHLDEIVPGYRARLDEMAHNLTEYDKLEIVRLLGKIYYPESKNNE